MRRAVIRLSHSMDIHTGNVRGVVDQIRDSFAAIDKELEVLCAETCTRCNEICCLLATVWYDFRDVLFLAATDGGFPEQQIFRKNDGSCSNLGPQGCTVPRLSRPFICTWYICSAQKEVLTQNDANLTVSCIQRITEIKQQRKLLEQLYLEAVCP